MFTEEDIKKVILAYEEKNIVTRKECQALNNRPLAREIMKELVARGYENAQMVEGSLEDRADYSNAIYNSTCYDVFEAMEYLVQNVLGK